MNLILISLISVLVLDQITKYIALRCLMPFESFVVIPHVLYFTLVKNTGIAFGMFQQMPVVIPILLSTGVALLLFLLPQIKRSHWYTKIAYGMLVGGAIGNIIDRVRFAAVIDFIDFRIWPVFNVADSFITISAAIFILYLFRSSH